MPSKRLNASRNSALFLTAFLSFLAPSAAEAAGGAIPFSVSAGPALMSKTPQDYPESAGGGMAISAFGAPFSTWKNGVEASAWTQGRASFLAVQYRHYVLGTAQYSAASRTNSSFKQNGWFIQGGAVLYNLVRTEVDYSTGSAGSSPNLYRIKGSGLILGMGWERPFWKGTILSPRIEYASSLGGKANFSGMNIRLQIGIPITIY